MNITLAPMQETTISQVGKTVVFLKGDGELQISANESKVRIKSNAQVSFDRFSSVTFQNFSDSTQTFEVLIVEGEYRALTEGSTVKADVINPEDVSRPIVLALSETLSTQLTNPNDVSDPIVQALAQELLVGITNGDEISGPIVQALAQELLVGITNADEISGPIIQALAQELLVGITNADEISGPIVQALTRELLVGITNPHHISGPIVFELGKKANTVNTNEILLTAGEPTVIPALDGRRDLRIKVKANNDGVVLVDGVPFSNNEFLSYERFNGPCTLEAVAQDATVYVSEILF